MTASNTSANSPRNRLDQCSSPYLRQHAGNPVDWWPWSGEALARARELERPILLSIGYSACHWCHVMAHESFEDVVIAKLMNARYINIKVDREERPDLDRLYQLAHQVLNQRPGGWPLTVFLTPDDLAPFFVGTYFPPEPRHGMPGFGDVLRRVAQVYGEQRDAVQSQNQRLLEALDALAPSTGAAVPGLEVGERALHRLAASFDAEHGGFGSAPKFPHASELAWLLRRYATSLRGLRPHAQLLRMARFSLERMVRGGLMDQLGGGFFRYSVDARWMIPHFEKMLYDNGPLLALCCDMYAATGATVFADAAHGIADWALREMQAPEGGYYASLDADSEGAEGRFYVWRGEELRAALAADAWTVFAERYGLDGPPNFEGGWHLHGVTTADEIAQRQGLDVQRVEALLAGARIRLLARREARVRPACDEKILPAWNALMISGMARAARVLGRADCLASAERALAFLRTRMWHDGRLYAACTDGHAHLDAYLDDYANLLDALLELLQVHWSSADLAWATELAEVLLGQFQDLRAGGFWFTASGHEALPMRLKPLADESLPAGNGVAALALQRFGWLLAEPRYLVAAEATLKVAAAALEQMPAAHATLLMALEEYHTPPELLIVRAAAERLPELLAEARQGYQPWRLVFGIPDQAAGLPEALAAKRSGAGPRLYRCVGTHCESPVDSIADLARQTSGG